MDASGSLSPFTRRTLEGYAEESTVHPGERVRLMLSGPDGQVNVRVVRLRHSDPNPAGPGFRADDVPWAERRSAAVRPQAIDFGSYIEVAGDAAARLNPESSFTLALWYLPTRLGGWQTLAAKYGPRDLGYGVFTYSVNGVTAAVSHDGVAVEWIAGKGWVDEGRWQFVALTYDAESGELALHQLSREPPTKIAADARSTLFSSARRVRPGPIHPSRAPLLLGALEEGERHRSHFNGKIADPVLLAGALAADAVEALAAGAEPATLAPVLAAWDLSRDVDTDRVHDASATGAHGRAVNAPARAVTGPSWRPEVAARFADDPASYRAIHVHDDDLDDACWAPTLEVAVPESARSGLYAAVVRSEDDEIVVPFIIAARAPAQDVLVLLPTLTWHAYNSNRSVWGNTEDGVLDRGLCIYDRHSDGSPVYYSTRRRPTRSWDPTRGFRLWGAHLQTASLYLLDWLEEKGFGYDVVADEDLDREGTRLVDSCRCLVIAGHTEYFTERMMLAVADYTRAGGRVAYLAGNGLYWVTSIDPRRSYLIEVRKSPEGDVLDWAVAAPGESQHSTTGEEGGLWAWRGLPPRSIVGVEFSANYYPDSGARFGFERTEASRTGQYAFVFDGVESDVVGDFGLNLGTAAGYEMDSVQEWEWEGAGPVVLARATHPSFVPLRNPPGPAVADIAFLELPGGGAVFAAGAVTWTGSLSHNGYDNNISRITENVLRRFLETPRGQPVS